MTRDEETAVVRQLLVNLQACRNSTAHYVTDESRDKLEILAGIDALIVRAREHLARLGHPDAHAPPIVAAPEAMQ